MIEATFAVCLIGNVTVLLRGEIALTGYTS